MRQALRVGLLGLGFVGCGDGAPAAGLAAAPVAAPAPEAAARYAKARALAERGESEARAVSAVQLDLEPEELNKVFTSMRCATAWIGAAQAALDAGLPDAARDCWIRAIGCFPDCPEARRGLGHVVYALPDGEPWDTLALEGMLDALDPQVGEWVTPERLAALRDEEATLRASGEAELARRAADPGHATRCQLARQVRAHPGFAGCLFDEAWVEPFVVLRERHRAEPSGQWPAGVAASLTTAADRFRAAAADVTGAPVEVAGPFVVVLVRGEETLDAYLKAASLGSQRALDGFFHIAPCWTVCHEIRAGGAPDLGLTRLALYQLANAWMNTGRDDGSRLDPALWISYGFAGCLTDGGRGPGVAVDEPELDANTAETMRELRATLARAGWHAGDGPTAGARGAPSPGTAALARWYGLQDVQRYLLGGPSDRDARLLMAVELAPVYLRAYATAFFRFCRSRPDLWPRLRTHVAWAWGRDPADQPPTPGSIRAWARSFEGTPDPSLAPAERCAAAFARAFTGVDMAQLDADFAAWVDRQLAPAAPPPSAPAPADGGR